MGCAQNVPPLKISIAYKSIRNQENFFEDNVQTGNIVVDNLDLSTVDNIQDHDGKNIRYQEEIRIPVSHQSINENQTIYINMKKLGKSISCPELPREDELRLSDLNFAQTFGEMRKSRQGF